jgi:hypothetical protein
MGCTVQLRIAAISIGKEAAKMKGRPRTCGAFEKNLRNEETFPQNAETNGVERCRNWAYAVLRWFSLIRTHPAAWAHIDYQKPQKSRQIRLRFLYGSKT